MGGKRKEGIKYEELGRKRERQDDEVTKEWIKERKAEEIEEARREKKVKDRIKKNIRMRERKG